MKMMSTVIAVTFAPIVFAALGIKREFHIGAALGASCVLIAQHFFK